MRTDRMAMTFLLLAFLVWNFTANGLAVDLADRLSAFGTSATTADEYDLARVPYVPTPPEVVTRMLAMADVGENDLVYDLGCGDGRIVVAAARDRGARGVGVDINPQRIRECRENAEAAGVSDRVEFLEQDLFITDLREASVVTLYLLPSVNLELRPKLLAELRPGTRVVSHDFDMGEWEPDDYEDLDGDKIYFWIVPANVSGTWEWRNSSSEGEDRYRLVLKQAFQEIDGMLLTDKGSMPIDDARLSGNRLEFEVRQPGGSPDSVRYVGEVQENTMNISRETGKGHTGWKAERDPETVVPLDISAIGKT